MKATELAWLAGYLEGEGSFCQGAPSSLNKPTIQLQTTDLDVARRAANLLGTVASPRGTPKKKHWKQVYGVTRKGRAAVALMLQLRPHMGDRRRAQIDRAAAGYKPARQRVPVSKLKELRRLADRGWTHAEIAEKFEVSRSYITHMLNKRGDQRAGRK